jgi:serine/threonine protein kinase
LYFPDVFFFSKASNLLISKNGIVKLTDFGISHLISIKSEQQNDALRTLRANKSLAGTGLEEAISSPYWMAPEVIAGEEETTTASDIWSVGCTAIELMSRVPPFFDLSVNEACLRVLDTPISYPGGLSKKGKKFLDLCFERNPSKRITAQELLVFLNDGEASPRPVKTAPAPAVEEEAPPVAAKPLKMSDSGAMPPALLSPRGNVDFFERVKTETNAFVYNEFLVLMKRFKLKQIDAQEVSRCAAKLFRYQKDIIADFNAFLPKKYRIDIHALEESPKNEEELEQLYAMLEEYRLTTFYDVIAERCNNLSEFCALSGEDLEGLGLKKFHVKKAIQIQQILSTKEEKAEEKVEEEKVEEEKVEEEKVVEEEEELGFEVGEVAIAAENLAYEMGEELSDEEEEASN